MKKYLALVLAVIMVLAFASCGGNGDTATTETPKTDAPAASTTEEAKTDIFKKSEGVMTYAQYMAAADGDTVVIEAFVQAKGDTYASYKNTNLYLADNEGAYYAYRLTVASDDDWAKIQVGTKLKITGVKSSYKGMVEINGSDKLLPATYEILDGSYVADAVDATAKINTEEAINYMSKLVTVEATIVAKEGNAFTYGSKGTGKQGDDLYFTAKVGTGETALTFAVETDITNSESAAYKAVEAFKDGDKVKLTGFVYWYDGFQMQVTVVSK